MATERIDRRVRRTRELLRNALLALVVEKGYERVTVQDVIDRADVGRSTFYAHFRDKEDLLLSGFDDFQDELARAVRADEGERVGRAPRPGHWPALAIIEHVAEYRPVSSMLGARGSAVAARRLHRLLVELLAEHVGAVAPAGELRVPREVAIEFAVSSLLGLIDWWLDHERPYPPEQLEEMYRRLSEPGLRAALRDTAPRSP